MASDLFKDNQYATRFPPAYETNDGLVKEVCDKVENAFPKGTRIFTRYDCVQHVKLFNFDAESIFEGCNGVNCDNVVTIVNVKHGVICVFKITSAKSEIELASELKQCNVILKALMTLFSNELGQAFLFGGLILTNLERAMMKEDNFFCLNGDYSSTINAGLVFVTKDDLESKDKLVSWWNRLRKKMNEERKRRMPKMPDLKYEFDIMCSQIFASMSLVSESLHITKSSKDRVNSLLLNKDQLNIVYSNSTLKLIQGPFGSGKSLILKALASKILKSYSNERASIVYVCWDPYSLIEAEINFYFQELFEKKTTNVTLQCVNLKQLAEENNFELENLLRSIGNKKETFARFLRIFCKEDLPCHLLIDEFPGVAIDKEVCNEIKNYKASSCEGSTLVIACQSTDKDYQIHSKKRVFKISKESLVDVGMKTYTLSKSMRMCSNLFDMVKVAQKQITSSMLPIVAERHVPMIRRMSRSEGDRTTSKDNENSKLVFSDEDCILSDDDIGDDNSSGFGSFKFPSTEIFDTLPMDSSTDSTPIKTDPSKLHEPEALLKQFSNLNREPSKSLKTSYKYPNGKSGHDIQSEDKPNLIYLPNEFQLDTAESVKTLQYLLEKFCITDDGPSFCQTTIICNNIEELRMVRFALRWMEEGFEEYTAYLRGHYPELNEKDRVFKRLREEAPVLVTDYRGFRGCQTEHCVCFVNQKDLYGDHILVEILTRAISRFDLIVYSQEKSDKAVQPSGKFPQYMDIPYSKVLDALKEQCQKSVNVHSVAFLECDNTSGAVGFTIDGDAVSIELSVEHASEYRERKYSIENEIESSLEEGIT